MANQPQVFKFDPNSKTGRPDPRLVGRTAFRLCQTDLVQADVSILEVGKGENQLHYHTGNDGFRMVLQGRAKFYTEGDVVVAELGKHEGILIPREFRYWFKGVNDEPLQILHVAAKAQNIEDKNIKPLRAAVP